MEVQTKHKQDDVQCGRNGGGDRGSTCGGTAGQGRVNEMTLGRAQQSSCSGVAARYNGATSFKYCILSFIGMSLRSAESSTNQEIGQTPVPQSCTRFISRADGPERTLRQRVHLKLLRSNLEKRGAGLMTGSSVSSSSSRSAGVDLVPGVLGGTWTTTTAVHVYICIYTHTQQTYFVAICVQRWSMKAEEGREDRRRRGALDEGQTLPRGRGKHKKNRHGKEERKRACHRDE